MYWFYTNRSGGKYSSAFHDHHVYHDGRGGLPGQLITGFQGLCHDGGLARLNGQTVEEHSPRSFQHRQGIIPFPTELPPESTTASAGFQAPGDGCFDGLRSSAA